MADNPRREAGRAMRRKLMGEAYAEQARRVGLPRSDHGEIRRGHAGDDFRHVVDAARSGSENPSADLRDFRRRHGPYQELKLHLRFARNQGWTEDELSEAMLHLTGYIGAPLVRGAMLTAVELFKEMRTEA